jgi:prophage tail gpP-like protein
MSIAPQTDRLVLTVHGQHWRGWTDVSVSRSVEAVAGAFEVTLTKRSGATLRFGPGDSCQLAIESEDGAREPVLTGWIDDMEPSFDVESHSVTIRGRDAAGDLVDCSAIHPPSGEWHGATLDQIARDLVAPYGLGVSVAADVGGPFGTFRIEEGETVWACLERACRYRGVLAISDGLGGLVLTTADRATPTGVTLSRGRAGPGELIEAASVFSHRDRFSEIIVSRAAGEHDHAVIAPGGNVVPTLGHIVTLGAVTWSAS